MIDKFQVLTIEGENVIVQAHDFDRLMDTIHDDREMLKLCLSALESGIGFIPAGYGVERQQWEVIEAVKERLK
jgi:hypothetical protein